MKCVTADGLSLCLSVSLSLSLSRYRFVVLAGAGGPCSVAWVPASHFLLVTTEDDGVGEFLFPPRLFRVSSVCLEGELGRLLILFVSSSYCAFILLSFFLLFLFAFVVRSCKCTSSFFFSFSSYLLLFVTFSFYELSKRTVDTTRAHVMHPFLMPPCHVLRHVPCAALVCFDCANPGRRDLQGFTHFPATSFASISCASLLESSPASLVVMLGTSNGGVLSISLPPYFVMKKPPPSRPGIVAQVCRRCLCSRESRL